MKIEKIPYQQTNRFAKIVTDYLQEVTQLQPFYQYKPNLDSFQTAITNKLREQIDGNLLSETISTQYDGITIPIIVKDNIEPYFDKILTK